MTISLRTIMISVLSVVGFLNLGFSSDSQPDEINKTEHGLLSFCSQSILYDRGFVNTPFAGSSEQWIASCLSKEKKFQAGLNLTQKQIEQLGEFPVFHNSQKKKIRSVNEVTAIDSWLSWKQSDPYRSHLLAILTPQQQEMLPGVYLNLEGMLAIVRPEFQKLIDIPFQKQKKILKLAIDTYNEKASIYFRMIFTLRNEDDSREIVPHWHGLLRKEMEMLDLKILRMLSRDEQEKLLKVVRLSYHQRPFIHGAGLVGKDYFIVRDRK